MNLEPIFVHASPRSCSTYFFHVLRKNPQLMCFNEAISDVYHIRQKPHWNINHDFLEKDDLAELRLVWELGIKPPPYPAFHDYRKLDQKLEFYIKWMILFAQRLGKRPVFCDIYSRYRAKALRAKFGGFHIAQVRDFKAQFGSFIRPLAEGGEWGFVAFPFLERGYSGLEAIEHASEMHIGTLEGFHWQAWDRGNTAAIDASHAIVDLDNMRYPTIDEVKLDFSDYVKPAPYPIPVQMEWREIVRRHRPSFKIWASKLPLARPLSRILGLSHRRYEYS